MMTFKKCLWINFLIFFTSYTTTWCGEKEWPIEDFEFVYNTNAQDFPLDYPEVTHIAVFHIPKYSLSDSWMYLLIRSPDFEKLSLEQQRFIKKFHRDYNDSAIANTAKKDFIYKGYGAPIEDYKIPKKMMTFIIPAVSKNDVISTVTILLKIFNHLNFKEYQSLKERFTDSEKNLEVKKNKLTELQRSEKELEAPAADEVRKYIQGKYGLHNEDDAYKDAFKVLDDFAYKLRLLEFDILKVQAKIEAINKIESSDGILRESTKAILEQLRITSDVELAGLLAQKNVFKKELKEAAELQKVVKAKRLVTDEIYLLKKHLIREQEEFESLEKRFQNLHPSMRPVKIHENKVMIYPVKKLGDK